MTEFEELNIQVSALDLPRRVKMALRRADVDDAATLLSIGISGLARVAMLDAAGLKAIRKCLQGPEMKQLSSAALQQVPIGDLGFDMRLRRLMTAYAIHTAADLEEWLPHRLERIPGVGRTTVEQSLKAMSRARRLARTRLRKFRVPNAPFRVPAHSKHPCRQLPSEIAALPQGR